MGSAVSAMSKPDPYQILRSKTDLSEEDLSKLSVKEAWAEIYQHSPRTKRPRDSRHQVCLTGFGPTERKELEEKCEQNDLVVKRSVTKDLFMLVCAEKPGPIKVQKAENQSNTYILNLTQFELFLKTGELPD